MVSYIQDTQNARGYRVDVGHCLAEHLVVASVERRPSSTLVRPASKKDKDATDRIESVAQHFDAFTEANNCHVRTW